MHTIDVDDDQVYEALKARAKKDRRTLRAYVNLVLERHVGMALEPETDRLPASREESGRPSIDELAALVNGVKPGAVVKGTALLDPAARRRAEQERVARQNHLRSHPEEESQDPRDYEDEGDVGF